jgi:hypothetical protein
MLVNIDKLIRSSDTSALRSHFIAQGSNGCVLAQPQSSKQKHTHRHCTETRTEGTIVEGIWMVVERSDVKVRVVAVLLEQRRDPPTKRVQR